MRFFPGSDAAAETLKTPVSLANNVDGGAELLVDAFDLLRPSSQRYGESRLSLY